MVSLLLLLSEPGAPIANAPPVTARVGLGRSNAIPNPRAASDLTGWTTNSDPNLARVTTVPGADLPPGASAAFRVGPTVGGTYLQCDSYPLPKGVAPGDYVFVQLEAFVAGATNDDAWLGIDIDWADGTPAYTHLTSSSMVLPTAGFRRFAFAAQVPTGATALDVYVTANERTSGGADDAVVYVTEVLVEPGVAGKVPGSYSDATHVPAGSISHLGIPRGEGISLAGWEPTGKVRTPITHSSARVTIRIAHRYARGQITGDVLPTDPHGWTLPDCSPPDIQSLSVTVGGARIPNARIVSVPIELSDRGGYISATLTVRLRHRDDYRFAWHANMVVSYKGAHLFRGRLEESSYEMGDELVRTMVFTGPIVTLEDHQSFRKVYVDSDLDNWRTDQGPHTASHTYEVSAGIGGD